jgi:hypothetical protein
MRAYNTNTSQHINWLANNYPDTTGVYSGVNIGYLTNISVNYSKSIGTRSVTSVTGNYTVLTKDNIILITTITAPYTITLPSSPSVGDEYTIKDTTGNVGKSILTISGNGNNIDTTTSIAINAPYFSITVIYNGTKWCALV